MKKLLIFLILLCFSTSAAADGWWNDWRDEPEYECNSDYDSGYEDGYDDGFYDGTNDPFSDDYDKPGAFGFWFLTNEWSEQELHAWASVFESLLDDKDRSWPGLNSVENPVYVAIVTGDVYHTNYECSSLANAYAIAEFSLDEAIQRNFVQCKKCK